MTRNPEENLLLQSSDKFAELARVDENFSTVTFLSRDTDPELGSSPVQGTYSVIDGKLCSFYRLREELVFRIEQEMVVFGQDVHSELVREGRIHVFKLLRDKEVLLSFKYTPPKLAVVQEDDPTPFVEYDDWDFFYFVHSVLLDESRRKRIYTF